MMPVEHVAGDVYRVGSESTDSTYIVDLAVPNCTCTNWKITRNREVGKWQQRGERGPAPTVSCKHIRAVELGRASVPNNPEAKKDPKAVSEATLRRKEQIVARFTAPAMHDRMLETLREAARLKEE